MASKDSKQPAQGEANLLQQIDDFIKSADELPSVELQVGNKYFFPSLSKKDTPSALRSVPVPRARENAKSGGNKFPRISVHESIARTDVEKPVYQTHSNTPTLSVSVSDESDSDEIVQRGAYADAKMRIGRDFQAVPSLLIGRPGSRCNSPDRALCVWTPVPEAGTGAETLTPLTDAQVASFVDLARDKFGYATEQALGMLYWHQHSLELATVDLPNFIPYPDEWTQEEKLVFDQAFSFQGKQFHKIVHALPDKTVPHLVKYYYQWKLTRGKTSLLDRRRGSKRVRGGGGGGAGSGLPAAEDEDEDDEEDEDLSGSEISDGELPELRPGCRRVRRPRRRQQPAVASKEKQQTEQQQKPQQSKLPHEYRRKMPRGIFLDCEALVAMSVQGEGQVASVLAALDSQLGSARSRVQRNRAQLTQRWEALLTQIQAYQEPDAEGQISHKWTDEELLLAVQGVRRYGKDFRAIAQLIGSKTENHVRYFFVQYRTKFGLDSVLADYNKETAGASK